MNLLDVDRLSELSQEFKKYSVQPTPDGEFILIYSDTNEGYFVYQGDHYCMVGFPDRQRFRFAKTHADAWKHLPEALKAFRNA